MKLSRYFTRAEFEKSQTATRNGINNTMTPEALQNAIDLCENILDPIRKHFGKPLIISSGYRSAKLNRIIGGSKNSQHSKGEAADIEVRGVSNWDVLRFITLNLDYDQLICEYMVKGNPDKGWIHVSYRKGGGRHMALTIDSTGTRSGIDFS